MLYAKDVLNEEISYHETIFAGALNLELSYDWLLLAPDTITTDNCHFYDRDRQ